MTWKWTSIFPYTQSIQIQSCIQINHLFHHTHKQTYVVADEQVLRFDVSVNHVLAVAVCEGFCHLTDVSRGSVLAESSFGCELLVQLSLGGESVIY